MVLWWESLEKEIRRFTRDNALGDGGACLEPTLHVQIHRGITKYEYGILSARGESDYIEGLDKVGTVEPYKHITHTVHTFRQAQDERYENHLE